MNMLAAIIEPLTHDFMQRALLAALIVGVVAGVLSCFIVLKGWSLMGDAITHAVLPGVVVAAVAGVPLVLGAFASGLLCAVLAGFIKAKSHIKENTALGIAFSGLFALGLVLFTRFDTGEHLLHVLFGNLLGLRPRDVVEIAIIGGLVLVLVTAFRRDLMLAAFDATHARAIGLRMALLHYGLLVMVAALTVAALKAVGIILVVSMLIAPGATAFLLVRRFDRMLAAAALAAALPAVLGTILSFHIDAAPGPTIVLLQSAQVVAAMIFWGRRRRAREQAEAVAHAEVRHQA